MSLEMLTKLAEQLDDERGVIAHIERLQKEAMYIPPQVLNRISNVADDAVNLVKGTSRVADEAVTAMPKKDPLAGMLRPRSAPTPATSPSVAPAAPAAPAAESLQAAADPVRRGFFGRAVRYPFQLAGRAGGSLARNPWTYGIGGTGALGAHVTGNIYSDFGGQINDSLDFSAANNILANSGHGALGAERLALMAANPLSALGSIFLRKGTRDTNAMTGVDRGNNPIMSKTEYGLRAERLAVSRLNTLAQRALAAQAAGSQGVVPNNDVRRAWLQQAGQADPEIAAMQNAVGRMQIDSKGVNNFLNSFGRNPQQPISAPPMKPVSMAKPAAPAGTIRSSDVQTLTGAPAGVPGIDRS